MYGAMPTLAVGMLGFSSHVSHAHDKRGHGTRIGRLFLQPPHADGGVETAGDQFAGVGIEAERGDRTGMAR
jgi:hypothetical protein